MKMSGSLNMCVSMGGLQSRDLWDLKLFPVTNWRSKKINNWLGVPLQIILNFLICKLKMQWKYAPWCY